MSAVRVERISVLASSLFGMTVICPTSDLKFSIANARPFESVIDKVSPENVTLNSEAVILLSDPAKVLVPVAKAVSTAEIICASVLPAVEPNPPKTSKSVIVAYLSPWP
jgi:hypothetical protein